MTEKLKKYLDLLPIAVPAIYILGFVVVNGQLSNYHFSDYNILNFTYLKAGILISFFIAIIFIAIIISFSPDTMTDNYKKSWPSLVIGTSNVLLVTLLLSFSVVDLKSLNENYKTAYYIVLIGFLLYSYFRIWASGKSPKNNLGILLLIVPAIVLLVVILITLGIYYKTIMHFLIFNSVLSIVIFLAIGEFGDKNYKARIVTDIIVLIGLCFFFGKYIFTKVPAKFGGGQPYEIVVAKSISINDLVNENRPLDTLQVLYENDSRLLVCDKSHNILFIDKGEVKAYKILNR